MGDDRWARWVLRPGSGLETMEPVRDRVLRNAAVGVGETLLDVGTGSGLIAFGALELVGSSGRVIFSDISQELLEHCRRVAVDSDVIGRCQFIVASADNLAGVPDESVDAITTRSVLIYVADKAGAFGEFFRVLRPGGRLSVFEPINRFDYPWPSDRFFGYDVAPVEDLARKLMTAYERAQPDERPMLDFDERDLLRHAEEAGFGEIHLTFEVAIEPRPAQQCSSWEEFLRLAGNPLAPTVEEVLEEALTRAERERFEGHLRPLVEVGRGVSRLALAYLWSTKPS
jgi:arsenite methyltransferase